MCTRRIVLVLSIVIVFGLLSTPAYPWASINGATHLYIIKDAYKRLSAESDFDSQNFPDVSSISTYTGIYQGADAEHKPGNDNFDNYYYKNPTDLSKSSLYIVDENGYDQMLGYLVDTTPQSGGDKGDGWTEHKFEITRFVRNKGAGTYHFKWKYVDGWDCGHVRNFHIKVGAEKFYDRDRGSAFKGDAVDGVGDSADGGEYVDHYVVLK